MLAPMTIKIIPIATTIAIRVMTWIVTMARFAILVPIRSSPVHGESIFETTRIDRVFTLVAARRMECPVRKLTPIDRSVEMVTLAQHAKLVPSYEPKELVVPPGPKIAASLIRSTVTGKTQ
jgi:hypothetical protein